MRLEVRSSASPLFRAVEPAWDVSQIVFSGNVSALPVLPPESEEGIDEGDDFPLRLGLVTEGTRTIGWLERLWAPKWLKELTDLAPNRGIGKIVFLTLAQKRPLGSRRVHPKNDHIEEFVVGEMKAPGTFTVKHHLQENLRAVAVWVQADGDDTKSSFDLDLEKIELEGTAVSPSLVAPEPR